MQTQIKTAILSLLISLLSFKAHSQDDFYTSKPTPPEEDPMTCPKTFLGVSTGINNNPGLLGFNLEVGVAKKISLGGGAGLSVWGYKGYLEGKYYFHDCYKGGAIGLALTRNTGIPEIQFEDETDAGVKQNVNMQLFPQTNFAIQGYHYFKMGKRHRFYLNYGYSFEITTKKYSVIGPNLPSKTLISVVDLMAPSGIIFGLGFSFGL